MKNFVAILLLLFVISCGKVEPKGDLEMQEVQLEKFYKMDLNGSFKVFYIQNPKTFLTVETYPNIYKNLKIKVEDSTLFISEKRETGNVDFYNITLYAPQNINSVKLGGMSDVYLSSQFKTPLFNLNLEDQSKFIGSVISKKTSVTMSGKTRANLLGETSDLKLIVKDTASIIAPYFLVKDLFLEAQNGSYSEVSIENEMSGKIDHTAKFTYFGDPYQRLKIGPKSTVKQKKLP